MRIVSSTKHLQDQNNALQASEDPAPRFWAPRRLTGGTVNHRFFREFRLEAFFTAAAFRTRASAAFFEALCARCDLCSGVIVSSERFLATEIIKAVDRERLSVRAAHGRTGIAAADFSRLRNADLGRFTVDRLMSILNRLGSSKSLRQRTRAGCLVQAHSGLEIAQCRTRVWCLSGSTAAGVVTSLFLGKELPFPKHGFARPQLFMPFS
jgi:hypothetical protein